jgi:uncharacterized damage-inducible protein DinB
MAAARVDPEGPMNLFSNAFRYNAWANARLGEVCQQLTPEQLNAPIEGMYGSTLATLEHLATVECAYFQLMGIGEVRGRPTGLETVLAELARVGATYAAFAEALDEAGMARRFLVPWFEREFSVQDGLFQVLIHSTEHRADIASALTRFGLKTPPIDYVIWVIAAGV